MAEFDNSWFVDVEGDSFPPVDTDAVEKKAALTRMKRMKDDFDDKWELMGPSERTRAESRLQTQRQKIEKG